MANSTAHISHPDSYIMNAIPGFFGAIMAFFSHWDATTAWLTFFTIAW